MNDFDWTKLISPAIQAGANYWSGNQVGKAGQTAASAADPFAQYRPQYANALADLQRDPSKVAETPGYRFAFDQGQQALERSAAAKGFTGSGNVLAELTKYGQGMAEQQFGKERDFLAKASGAYLDPSVAARIGLDSRMQQLGDYNQGIGELMSGAQEGGAANSLANLYKTGKGLYDAYNAGSGIAGAIGSSGIGGGGLAAGGTFGAGQTAGNYLLGSGLGTEGGAVGSSLYAPTATEAAIDSGTLGAGAGAGGGAATGGTLSAGGALGGAGAVYAIGNALMNYADKREAPTWNQNIMEMIRNGNINGAKFALDQAMTRSAEPSTKSGQMYGPLSQERADIELNRNLSQLQGASNLSGLVEALYGPERWKQYENDYRSNFLKNLGPTMSQDDYWRYLQANADNSGGG